MRWTASTLDREAHNLGLSVAPEQSGDTVVYRIHRGTEVIFVARGLGNAISYIQGYRQGRDKG